MLTQCPECNTVFRVRPDQLKAAKGKVRCSRCHTVFNAMEHEFRAGVEESTGQQVKESTSSERRATAATQRPTAANRAVPQQAQAAEGPPARKAVPKTATARGKSAKAASHRMETPSGIKPAAQKAIAPRHRKTTAGKKPGETGSRLKSELASSGESGRRQAELFPENRTPSHAGRKPQPTASTPVSTNAKADSHRSPVAGDISASRKPSPAAKAHRSVKAKADKPSAEKAQSSPTGDKAGQLKQTQTGTESRSPKKSVPPAKQAKKQKDERSAAEDTELEKSLFQLFEDVEDEQQGLEDLSRTTELPSERGIRNSNPEPASDDNWDLFSDENIEAVQGPYSVPPPPEQQESERENSPDEKPRNKPQSPLAEDETLAGEKAEGEQATESKSTGEAPAGLQAQADEGEPVAETPESEQQPPEEKETAEDGYVLPPQFQQQSATNAPRGLLWGGGILLLLVTLVFQYFFYYQRDTLAENTTLRPLINKLCEFADCRLPPRQDVTRIELADHLMQTHPRYEDSLLITAILVNRAEYTQPFPIVEVVLTDLQQKVIARRHFRPEQYLIGGTSSQEFIPDTEIPLMLEVVDPGENAVGFEFNFY